jgi:selenoprotein W-related protein
VTETTDAAPSEPVPGAGPRVLITYCTQCRWLLRATWLGSELLTSFGTEIGELALRPGTGGVFRVRVDDEVVWDRAVDGGFPDLGPLKRVVRDRVAPGRSLGHTDRVAVAQAEPEAPDTGS